MAYIKEKTNKNGIKYNYWVIDKFNIFYAKGKGIVDIMFSGYVSKDTKAEGFEAVETINQQISFDDILEGFGNMIGFSEDNIKAALYTLKDKYEWFVDAVND